MSPSTTTTHRSPHDTSARKRSRSRSPRHSHEQSQASKRPRSTSPSAAQQPHRKPHRHHHDSKPPAAQQLLPFQRQPLRKRDFDAHRALFAHYLDLQKDLRIELLESEEVRGRWKSFAGKWNRGELAEGWYDPGIMKGVQVQVQGEGKGAVAALRQEKREEEERVAGSDDDDDGYGPALPTSGAGGRLGPTVPSLDDLQYRSELADEDRRDRVADLRYERKQDRQKQKERLEDLVPRAEPGSRERQLEKKRDVAASNRSFAQAKEAGVEEVGDGELLGDDGVDAFKAKKRLEEKKRSEREIRKEEVLRARAAEREVRLAEHRRKEEKTMDMLKDLARQRFGARD
ncbi:hypothetical protein BDY17DRAFT_18577 [Neohortaea acidophila]|uniref:Uncharacterized protein n=1 Tax=Neohortaea acidophila TaxID=245834 RepID=A0A6A6Q5R4_9PEZI|nr:uncharacterized protein BDY17DRAFT_18577 [Neohortaea acidophila]KAF2487788.1 hypothetical protein BDY17DRAFT_18577 [Neohortaea acidophila]